MVVFRNYLSEKKRCEGLRDAMHEQCPVCEDGIFIAEDTGAIA